MGLGAGGSGSSGGQANDGGEGDKGGGSSSTGGGQTGRIESYANGIASSVNGKIGGVFGINPDQTGAIEPGQESGASSSNNLLRNGNVENGSSGYDSGAALAAANIEAARIQAEAYEKGLALQKEIYEQTREDTRPWRETGTWALGELKTGINNGDFDPGEFKFNFTNDDPSYQFRVDENMKALDRSAAARGMTQSGAQHKAISRYSQDLASTEYGNAFNRALQTWDSDRTRKNDNYNRFAGLSGTGASVTNSLGNIGSNYASTASSTLAASGTAQAQGILGAEQARTSAYQYEQDLAYREQEQSNADRASKNNMWGTAIGIGIGVLGI